MESLRKTIQATPTKENSSVLVIKQMGNTDICNPQKGVCVAWENNNSDPGARGKAIAFRTTETDHYAEVKTQGFASNTTVTITQNDNASSTIIGDGSYGGNVVTIIQNTGVKKR